MKTSDFQQILLEKMTGQTDKRAPDVRDSEPRHLGFLMGLIPPTTHFPSARMSPYIVIPKENRAQPNPQSVATRPKPEPQLTQWGDLSETARLAWLAFGQVAKVEFPSEGLSSKYLRSLYRRLVRQFHPDSCRDLSEAQQTENREKFELATETYRQLSQAIVNS